MSPVQPRSPLRAVWFLSLTIAATVVSATLLAADKPTPPAEKTELGVARSTGEFRGRITLLGKFAAREPLVTKGSDVKDAAVCALADIPDESFVFDEKTRGIANVLVCLRQVPAGYKSVLPKEPLKMEVRGCRISPHIAVARAGQPIEVTIKDPVAHNLHWFPDTNSRFQSPIPPSNTLFKERFDKPERFPMVIRCDLHPWLKGYQAVVDHPFVAVTNERGEFAIPDLPPGDHQFSLWQERANYLHRAVPISIRAGEITNRDFHLKAERFPLDLR